MPQSFSKIWIIIVLITIIVGGIFAYKYWWVPKEESKAPEEIAKDETADWQTHIFDFDGFQIKYPKDWKLEKDLNMGSGSFINPSCDSNRLAGVDCAINYSVEKNTNLISIDKWIDDNLHDLYFPRNKETYIVDGVEGRRADITLVHNLKGVIVVFPSLRNGLVYEFVTGKEVSSTLYKMLSTFKFLE